MKEHRLPHRPKSHVTGDQAVLALRNVLPKHWIFREAASDYGIDCEIEIVTEEGAVTGAIVKGQVKGTSSYVKVTKTGVKVASDSVRYWLAMSVPVVIVRVTENPRCVHWIHVRDYLLLKDRLDSVYRSQQESFFFSFRHARLLPNDAVDLQELTLQHQANVSDMQIATEQDVGGQFIGYVVMVKLFDGDPDKWIQWLREKGSKDQLLVDLPFAFWVEEQSKKDPNFLNQVRKMVEEAT
jgi:hypothetical protein